MLWFLILIALFFCYLYHQFIHRRKIYPPGPCPLPIVGNTFSIDANNPSEQLNKWGTEYKGIYTAWMPDPQVVITDFKLLKEAFVGNADCLADRPEVPIVHMFMNGTFGITFTYGSMWREQRRFSLHVLKDFGFGRNINDEIDVLVEYINEQCANNKSNKCVLYPADHLMACAGSIIGQVAIGERYKVTDDRFRKLRKLSDDLLWIFGSTPTFILNAFPFLKYVPIWDNFGYNEVKRIELRVWNVAIIYWNPQMRDLFYTPINKYKAMLEENPDLEADNYCLAYLKEMQRRKNAGESMESYSEWQLYVSIVDLWSAAMETTSTTLEWAILYMCIHQDVQKRVQKEIDSVLPHTSRVTMSMRKNMPYTNATMHEIQRCANVIPLNVLHSNKHEFTIGGYQIPKGTAIVGQISAPHEDEKYFLNPTKFDPQRFIDSPECIEMLNPFSLGKRQCIGESLARMELFMIFVTLMQRYSFKLPDNVNPNDHLKRIITFTSHPVPYQCEITIREDV